MWQSIMGLLLLPAKVIELHLLNFKPIFDPPPFKNCKGAPAPFAVRGALVRLGHFLTHVKIWGRNTL